MLELREVMNYARVELERKFRNDIFEEAQSILADQFEAYYDSKDIPNARDMALGDAEEISDRTREQVPLKGLIPDDAPRRLLACIEHIQSCPSFNLRSFKDMRRWLFEVNAYQPLKSTPNKDAGRPSIPWEKVVELPPSQRKNYHASYDVQTMQILSEKHNDKLLDSLLDLNKVGNICKAMLPEPEVDSDGKITEEKGQLYAYLCSDDRIHGQMSTTETGRPRSWNPNVLNWPSYVDSRISGGIKRAFQAIHDDPLRTLPAQYLPYIQEDLALPSIRSCVLAPEGWCMVESDYATAEIRGLAFISGDENLIRIMTQPDPQFVCTKDEDVTRVSYESTCGIPRAAQDMALIMAKTKGGEIIGRYSAGDILVGDDGKPVSPSVDLHWSLAEMTNKKPREYMIPKMERAGAKVGNFSSAYGASPGTLERKIEADTGVEVPEGTGQAILDALEQRQPVAVEFLETMETLPLNEGRYRAASGRIRRFARLGSDFQAGFHARDAISGMGREARNFPMQESVAATASRAAVWLLDYYIKHDMQARPMIVLYDAVVTLCPLEERHRVAELHQRFMTDENTWTYHGREMNYPIDVEYNQRWSTKPTAAEAAILGKPA